MHIMQPLPAAVSHGSSLLAAAGVLVTRPVAAAPPPRRGSCRTRRRAVSRIECRGGGGGEKVTVADAVAVAIGQDVTMTATVTTKVAAGAGGFFSHMGVDGVRDDIADLLHKSILLELVSSELDPKTGEEKQTVSGYARLLRHDANEATYEATFTVPASFGPVGAVVVENEHRREMFLKDIVVAAGDDDAPATFDCNSWVHSKFDNPHKRAFFPLKSYLPSRTPKGVEWLRKSELAAVHGDGSGERKSFERVYDYDVYNDLGDPDSDPDTTRPVLGGKDHPYPRRCRTGRHRSKIEPSSEARSGSVYVPRDEVFSEVKGVTFSAKTLRSALHAVVPSIETALIDASMGFPHFMAIDSLFDDGIELPSQHGVGQYLNVIPRLIKVVEEVSNFVLRFETPAMSDRDKFAWFRDEEFGRQTLAGLNPLSIQLVTEFPIVSKLDQETYGSPESLITKELIEEQINGSMTAEQAVASKKLFMLDYHDLFLPYVNKVRELDGTTLYGSRTLFFLTKQGTLNPIAIELTRPKSPAKPQWRQVFTHRCDATGSWLWKLAKAHVLAHDSGYHQLVSHWLRTHCCVEPYIIAANRCLSRMHPIYRLLHPHFRYTMEINALAREYLVSGKGIIESTFSPGKYSMELSSAVYDKLWRFDMEALPADLIRRGMAYESDDDGELKLTIEDYPYANDGLLVWDSIKEWANDYVAHYYPTGDDVAGDEELQGWWTEVRTKGHADKKDEPWWLALDSQENLVHVLTTIMWVTSGHHAAVNFGQYHYAGYFPNRPTIVRENMPVEEGHGEEEMERFLAKPEETMLRMFPSQIQAAVVMTVLDILSSHSPDEEYMGEHPEPAWTAEPMVKAAFEKLSGRMKEIEGTVDQRNESEELRNRCGAGVVPYELLKPFSGPGVTGRGIPNSISI